MTAIRVGTLRAYWELGKPRLSMMAVFAVVAGAYMAWPSCSSSPPLDLLVATTLGTFLAAVGAAALNMYRERHLDPLMHRTQGRPLPTGRLSPRSVLVFGATMSVLGVLLADAIEARLFNTPTVLTALAARSCCSGCRSRLVTRE